MPTYLVRWPDLMVSIVRAKDRQDLDLILDEVRDPGSCKVKEYDGPLFLTWELDADYTLSPATNPPAPRSVSIRNVSSIVEAPTFTWFREEGSDTRGEMDEKILKFAFPNYARYIDEESDIDADDEQIEDLCKVAISKDLDMLVKYALD